MSDLKPEIRRFSDEKWNLPPGVANLRVADILDLELSIIGIELVATSFGDAVRFTCMVNGRQHEVLTHSQVLHKQLIAIVDMLPMICTVRKTGRSFTLS